MESRKNLVNNMIDVEITRSISEGRRLGYSLSPSDIANIGQNGLVNLLYHNNPDLLCLKNISNYNKLYAFEFKIFKDALDNSKIKYIVLKGFAMANSLYSKPNLRPITDIDILVQKEDLLKTIYLFSKLGYSIYFTYKGSRQILIRKRVGRHFFDFDIHVELFNSPILSKLSKQLSYFDNTETCRLDFVIFNNKYKLLHAIFHYALHRSKGDLLKIIWLYDIHLIISAMTDEEKTWIINFVTTNKVLTVFNSVLNDVEFYFGKQIIKTSEEEKKSWMYMPLTKPNSKYYLYLSEIYSQSLVQNLRYWLTKLQISKQYLEIERRENYSWKRYFLAKLKDGIDKS